MKLQRVCELASRSTASPILPFLAPAFQTLRVQQPYLISRPQYRPLSSTRCLLAAASTASDASNPSPQNRERSQSVGPDSRASAGLNSKGNEKIPTAGAQADTASSTDQTTPSATEPMNRKRSPWGGPMMSAPRPSSNPGDDIQKLASQLRRRPQVENSAELLQQRIPKTPTERRQEEYAEQARSIGVRTILLGNEHLRIDPQPPLRLDAYMGRAQVVENNGFSRSMSLFKQKSVYNDIKSTFMRQRFHERAGLKRKRLKRTRWRSRFKDGFKHMVEKVKKMKAQGW